MIFACIHHAVDMCQFLFALTYRLLTRLLVSANIDYFNLMVIFNGIVNMKLNVNKLHPLTVMIYVFIANRDVTIYLIEEIV